MNDRPANRNSMDQPLRNPRHERFAQLLFEGLPASRAFEQAGYAPNDGNAIRLKGNEKVQARLRELQAQAAAKTEVTLQTILADLVDAAAVAKDRGQGQALVSAAMAKAKLLGLDVQRIEVGEPGSFAELTTKAEIIDSALDHMAAEKFYPVDKQDRQQFEALTDRHHQELMEFFEAIKSRPRLTNRVDIRRLPDHWQSLDEHFTPRSPARRLAYHSNGAKPPITIEPEVRKMPAEE
jgi:hypothetical protein